MNNLSLPFFGVTQSLSIIVFSIMAFTPNNKLTEVNLDVPKLWLISAALSAVSVISWISYLGWREKSNLTQFKKRISLLTNTPNILILSAPVLMIIIAIISVFGLGVRV
ncbi:Unannotated [Lentimonas sp. CC4]|nr:Unannotated [Lentimonas sp. CC4]CAA6684373.1 Unannotated [Lentimonas sp. CC6]CAA7078107.1 Unannotated [Lentimonas sp. CC4]CAA7172077.1 Unannotated [Lentimonas sp. CC21]CAA7183133.1 Unannotated [Lentimonas sp. CC8]